jgi:hypothetical protein
MIAYHGSNSNFKTLKISKSLVQHKSTLENEGLGIYISTNPEVAKTYGKYTYVLEINDKCIVDFRKKATCTAYVNYIAKSVYDQTKVYLSRYMNLTQISDRIYLGAQSIANISHEIQMELDSNERWYTDIPESTQEKVYRTINKAVKTRLKAYMFNYHIADIGVIKDVSLEVVRIQSKINNITGKQTDSWKIKPRGSEFSNLTKQR